MANFTVNGLDKLDVSIAQLAAISDGDLLSRVVLPAAEKLVTSMKDKAGNMMNVITGSLMGSVEILGQGSLGAGVFAQVGPNQGKHPKSGRGVRHRTAQGGGGGHYKGSNAEIAFIHEYGSSRTPGVHWMETAVNEDEGAIHSIMESGFESLINEKF